MIKTVTEPGNTQNKYGKILDSLSVVLCGVEDTGGIEGPVLDLLVDVQITVGNFRPLIDKC